MGYNQREGLTQQHFIKNPFEPTLYKTLYKTGDLARWLSNGDIEYLGRNNEQVKINGVRIEPREITLSILNHNDVSDCIVVKKIDTHGHDYLACYLIPKDEVDIDVGKIKKDLMKKFPPFMLPKTYLSLDSFPLTPNGKVDIDALPYPNFKNLQILDDSGNSLKAIEKKLLCLWQLALEVNQIEIEDNFFDIGGHSLLSLKLISLIHEHFNTSMKIRDIFTYPTVKQQAHHIKSLREHAEKIYNDAEIPSPLLCLQPRGKKTPLFLIHPIGGTVFWFTKLAKLLGNSRPIYGIQDPSIDIGKPILNSIEEMALFYLAHIKKIQPEGPYLIGGASFGATIAAEISKILCKNKEALSALFIFDGWGLYPNTLLDDNYFRQSMLKQHQELKEGFNHYGLPSPEILFDIQWFRLQLLWKYRLTLIESPIVLFKSKEIMAAFKEIDDPYNHWKNFTNQYLHLITTPGTHETMFQEPHVHELSDLLKKYLFNNNL